MHNMLSLLRSLLTVYFYDRILDTYIKCYHIKSRRAISCDRACRRRMHFRRWARPNRGFWGRPVFINFILPVITMPQGFCDIRTDVWLAPNVVTPDSRIWALNLTSRLLNPGHWFKDKNKYKLLFFQSKYPISEDKIKLAYKLSKQKKKGKREDKKC